MKKLDIYYLVIQVVFLVIVMRQKRQKKQDKKKKIEIELCLIVMYKTK